MISGVRDGHRNRKSQNRCDFEALSRRDIPYEQPGTGTSKEIGTHTLPRFHKNGSKIWFPSNFPIFLQFSSFFLGEAETYNVFKFFLSPIQLQAGQRSLQIAVCLCCVFRFEPQSPNSENIKVRKKWGFHRFQEEHQKVRKTALFGALFGFANSAVLCTFCALSEIGGNHTSCALQCCGCLGSEVQIEMLRICVVDFFADFSGADSRWTQEQKYIHTAITSQRQT